jgi:spermidine synthase
VLLAPSLSDRLHEIAVIGLGAGSMACYERPGRHFTYYEIDPMVESIARDPRYFTLLRDCSPGTKVVIGDARLSLQNTSAHSYDLVIADAFSSDTVPAHLITREAIQLYLSRLTEHGLLAFNISNRYLDLRPVFGALAKDAGLAWTVQEDMNVTPVEQASGKSGSTWFLMARKPSDLAPLTSQSGWHQFQVDTKTRVWTDDYSSIAGIIHWN